MQSFTYYVPTKVHFGKGVENNVGEVLKSYGATKVLIHYGGGSIKRIGLLDRITASLTAAGLSYVELGGVEPNPKVAFVREGVELCKKENIDFILAVGGGSAIDSAKSLALCYANDMDPWDISTGKVTPTKITPLGTVLTLSAAGSEMSMSHVLSNPEVNDKRGINLELVRPLVSFENPELTYTVSKYQTGCGIVDIMMHTLERYFQVDRDNELTERISEAIILTVKNAGETAIENPNDYEARAALMWASSLSHNTLTQCGKNMRVMAVHQLEHGVSGVFDSVSHGAGLAVLFPAWAQYVYKYDIPRFAQLASRVWGVSMNYENPEVTAVRGIRAIKDYFRYIGMPTTMAELGIGPESFEKIANVITRNNTFAITSYLPLTNKEILDIFNLAK